MTRDVRLDRLVAGATSAGKPRFTSSLQLVEDIARRSPRLVKWREIAERARESFQQQRSLCDLLAAEVSAAERKEVLEWFWGMEPSKSPDAPVGADPQSKAFPELEPLPDAAQRPTVLSVQDCLGTTRDLLEALFMAVESLEVSDQEGGALLALLSAIQERVEKAIEALEALKGKSAA